MTGRPGAAFEPADIGALGAELIALVGRVRPWSTSRWARGTNSAVAYGLVEALVRLTRSLPGTVIPPDARPPRLGDHALADQLAVVGAGLVQACSDASPGHRAAESAAPGAPDVIGDARRLVREAGRQLS